MPIAVKTLIERSVVNALGLPRSPIMRDVRDRGIDAYNQKGRDIWNVWPWDDEKLDEIAISPDENGEILLPASVESVQAVVDGSGYAVANRDPITAWRNGIRDIFEGVWEFMAPVNGQKRIKVDGGVDDTFYVLALAPFTDATVESAYDAQTPEATPTDYRTLSWTITRAESALMELIDDELRDWAGIAKRGKGDSLLQNAIARDTLIDGREVRMVPAIGMFHEVGEY